MNDLRDSLSHIDQHSARRSTTALSDERWGEWMLYIIRGARNPLGALRNYLWEYLTAEERAEVDRAEADVQRQFDVAASTGAHLLPGDLPPL